MTEVLAINGLCKSYGKIKAICGLLLALLSGAVSGIIFTKNIDFPDIFQKAYVLAVYFIQAVSYMTLGFLIVVLFRNTALSIVMFLLYLKK